MKIDSDRSELDNALKDPRNTFLFLFGDPNTVAEQIHNKAVAVITDDDRKTFWIAKPEILIESERTDWYKDNDLYTMLSAADDGVTRKVISPKPLTGLCMPSGDPSVRSIKAAFADAEKQ